MALFDCGSAEGVRLVNLSDVKSVKTFTWLNDPPHWGIEFVYREGKPNSAYFYDIEKRSAVLREIQKAACK